MVQLDVFQESPELHSRHDERVVRRVVVAERTVEVVDLAEACHVAEDDEEDLCGFLTSIFLRKLLQDRINFEMEARTVRVLAQVAVQRDIVWKILFVL